MNNDTILINSAIVGCLPWPTFGEITVANYKTLHNWLMYLPPIKRKQHFLKKSLILDRYEILKEAKEHDNI